METMDLVADGRLAIDGERMVALERFAADETWVAVAIPPGRRVSAAVDLKGGAALDVSGALKCRAHVAASATSELIVEVADSDRTRLERAIPIDSSGGWFRHSVDLSRCSGREVTVFLEGLMPNGCSLLLREVNIRHSVPLEPPLPDPPIQIVLISLDTLRSDVVDQSGNGVATPHLDEFALEAERFSRHYAAASWTKPSHASMLSGFHPDTHRALTLNQAIDPAVPTLAERFVAGGYETAALVYDCGWLSPKWGFAKGFDSYRMTRWRAGRQLSAAARWVNSHREEPFFFFVHTFEPHSDFSLLPYEAPGTNRRTIADLFGVEDFGRRNGRSASSFLISLDRGEIPRRPKDAQILRATYEAGVRYLDQAIGSFFNQLRSSGVWDQMLIVVTSDHGEEFDEHGGFGHGPLYEEIIRVPLLIKWPSSERARRTDAGPSSSVDLAPTLLRFAGLPSDGLPGAVLGGRSADDPVFSGTIERAVIVGSVKGIFGGPGDASEVYDLALDPDELDNTAEINPKQSERLRELLRLQRQRSAALYRRFGSEPADREVVLSESERERLRAFGYIQ
jgi:arylsulfatase A-like enzyme